MRVLLVFLSLTACSFDEGGVSFSGDGGAADRDAEPGPADGAQGPDGGSGIDAGGCAGDNLIISASNIADSCDIPAPTGSFELLAGDWTLDTDAHTINRTDDLGGSPQALDVAWRDISQANGPDVLLLSVQDFTIKNGFFTTELEVVGSRALLIVAFGKVSIEGEVRVGARGTTGGSGADHPGACAGGFGSPGVVQLVDADSGGSGGGGGAFGNNGGGGAKVDDDSGPLPEVAAAGGTPNGVTAIEPLRGGCGGGAGANSGGQGGGGGGALQITANGSITIDGYIGAPGAGGRGVNAKNSGGGGGGAGGALLLESGTAITITGALTANGGGGGEGTRGGGTFGGDSGNDGSYDSDDQAAGGASISVGGNGGRGGSKKAGAEDGTIGQSSGSSVAGGGGGGGSIGRIHLSSPNTSSPGLISPAPQ